MLRGEETDHRTETVSVIENWRCIRTRDYKLIQNYNDLFELYDLREDPDELRNVADQRPEVRDEMVGRLRERFFGTRTLSSGMPIRI